jgi:hypothetical protein
MLQRATTQVGGFSPINCMERWFSFQYNGFGEMKAMVGKREREGADGHDVPTRSPVDFAAHPVIG